MTPKKPMPPSPYADIRTVGIPRALMFYRYETLWTSFFEAIGIHVVTSEPSERAMLERGDALSMDECCLASKLYMGHADSLMGACDAIFVPSLANLGRFKSFCTKFQALPDLVANTFADQRIEVLSCLVNEVDEHKSMKDALIELATQRYTGPREAKRAWKAAARAQEQAERAATLRQTRALSQLEAARAAARRPEDAPLAILLAAHPYLAHDAFMGGALTDLLESMNAVVLFADEADRERSLQASFDFSDTLPWIVNREIIGAITQLHHRVDGIVLVSAFPCGPDSMTDDAIVRCIQGKPVLNLTIDAQSGTAGLETRVESFIDILRYQKKGGYVGA